MNPPETLGPTKPSLARDWLAALRYWLRGRNGMIAAIVVALAIGAALNWSWLVAVGIAPLLIAVLPCVAMCALGLCMSRMTSGSCSHETRPLEAPKPDARVVASLEAREPDRAPLLTDMPAPPYEPDLGTEVDAGARAKPEERKT